MNANRLMPLYRQLRGAERVRLLLAALDRQDRTGLDRIARSAVPDTWVVPDHFPAALALQLLADQIFLDVSDAAAACREALHCTSEGLRPPHSGDEDTDPASGGPDGPGWSEDRRHALCRAFYGILRIRTLAWLRFCREEGIPPWILWKHLPGYARLRTTLAECRTMAFTRAELIRWMIQRQPRKRRQILRKTLCVDSLARGIQALHQRLRELCSDPD